MKKPIAFLFTLLLVLSISACGGGSTQLSGDYVENTNGTIISFKGNNITIAGYLATYKLKNGIITISYDGRSTKGIYDANDDTITVEGEFYVKAEKAARPSEESGTNSNSSNNKIDSGSAMLEGILEGINSDFYSTIADITNELKTVYSIVGDSYESYIESKAAITDWYASMQNNVTDLYERTINKTVEYYKTMVEKIDHGNSKEINAAMDTLYDTVYENAFGEIYDAIYTIAFDEIYDRYYSGVLNDAHSSVSFGDLLDQKSDFYGNLLNAKSDFYGSLLDAKSDMYSIMLDVKSSFWLGDFGIDSILEKRKEKNNVIYTEEPSPIETVVPTLEASQDTPPDIAPQTLSFCGIDFSIPPYYDELVNDTTDTYTGYVYPERTSLFSYLCFYYQDSATVTQQSWDTLMSNFEDGTKNAFDTLVNNTNENNTVLNSRKTSIAGMSAWTLAFSYETQEGYFRISSAGYVYNANEDKLIYVEIQCVQHYKPDTSNIDYISDFDTILATAVRSPNSGASGTTSGTSSDWREFLKDYEEFVDAYIQVFKKYMKNPLDFSILNEYTDMMNKADEWSDKYDNISAGITNSTEYTEFLKEWTRIYSKMLNAFTS